MSFDEKSPQTGGAAHRIVLDNRNRLTVSGVDGVESFDETSIVMSTAEGSLIIRGESLHIEKLSLDGGDLLVEGTVDSLTYEEEEPRQGSFLGRLFRGCASPFRSRSPLSFPVWPWGWAWGCCMICSAWSASPCPAGPSRKFWTSCFGWGPAGCSFSAGSSSATAGCGCTWPCACCWGQRLIFFCSAPGPGGRWTSWPGPPPGFWAG